MNKKSIIALLILLEGIAFLAVKGLPVSSIITESRNFLLGYDFYMPLILHFTLWIFLLTGFIYFQLMKKDLSNQEIPLEDKLSHKPIKPTPNGQKELSEKEFHKPELTDEVEKQLKQKAKKELEEEKIRRIEERLNSLYK